MRDTSGASTRKRGHCPNGILRFYYYYYYYYYYFIITSQKYLSIRGIKLIRLRIGVLETPSECGIETPGSITH